MSFSKFIKIYIFLLHWKTFKCKGRDRLSHKGFGSQGRQRAHQYPKRNSFWWNQPIVTSANVIISSPPGYPDHFYPDETLACYKVPSRRIQLEATLRDLISPKALHLENITVLSSVRKDGFYKISDKGKGDTGRAIFLAHRAVASRYQLPFYKGNDSIVQNGFKVKVKDLRGIVVATILRKTLLQGDENDSVEVYLADKDHSVGQVKKLSWNNDFKVYGERGELLYIIQKAEAMNNSKSCKNTWKYVIIEGKNLNTAGRLSCSRRKSSQTDFALSVEFIKENMTILDKVLLLGALFLIDVRSSISKSGQDEPVHLIHTDENETESFNAFEI